MFEHYLDPARKGAEPVKVRAAITVSGDSLVVDFAGSSPQVMGPGNSGEAVAATGTFIVLKTFLILVIRSIMAIFAPLKCVCRRVAS